MAKLNNSLILTFCFAILSCSRLSSLNMLPYQGVRNVKNTIWFHLEGLTQEHVALIKFIKKSQTDKTVFEQMNCVGQVWNYNFFELRPNPLDSFLMFLTGTKESSKSCAVYGSEPFWARETRETEIVILENSIEASSSFDLINKCDEKEVHTEFFRPKSLIMRKGDESKVFHKLSLKGVNQGIQYDLSCQQGQCQTSMAENVNSIIADFKKANNRFMLVVRDGTIKKLVEQRKVIKLREYLLELERLLNDLIRQNIKSNDTLLVITSSNGLPIELPMSGAEWRKFESTGQNILYKRESLISPVYVRGPGSQNFCGLFEAAEFSKRLYWEDESTFLFSDLGLFQ